jgi:hypothetical protein
MHYELKVALETSVLSFESWRQMVFSFFDDKENSRSNTQV